MPKAPPMSTMMCHVFSHPLPLVYSRPSHDNVGFVRGSSCLGLAMPREMHGGSPYNDTCRDTSRDKLWGRDLENQVCRGSLGPAVRNTTCYNDLRRQRWSPSVVTESDIQCWSSAVGV